MTSSEQNRRSPRVDHEVMVAVRAVHERSEFTGWGTNLSASGVFVNTPAPPKPGVELSLLLQLPGIPECKLRGRVAWARAAGPGVDQAGMGVQFIEPDDQTQKLLAQMVQRLTVDLAAG